MNAPALILSVVSVVLAYAILRARQGVLMAAVAAYAGSVTWIIHRDMGMLMMALGVAIALGVLGLGVVVWNMIPAQNDTTCHAGGKADTNNDPAADNIGS